MTFSPLKPSTKPMKRSGFNASKKFAQLACRKTPSAASASSEAKLPFTSKSGLLRTANIKAGEPKLRASRKSIRSKSPRMTPIRKSARGEECTLRLPGVCNFDPATTVLCHENGAGAGMKSADECGVYGCYACHMVLDGHVTRPTWLTRDFVLEAFVRANGATRQILKRKGLIA